MFITHGDRDNANVWKNMLPFMVHFQLISEMAQ